MTTDYKYTIIKVRPGYEIKVYYLDERIAWNTRLFKGAAVRYGERKVREHKAMLESKEVHYV